MAVNKIVINDEVKIDLTADTVSPSTLALGITAHDKSGNIITGTMDNSLIPTETLLKFTGDLSYFDYNGRMDNWFKTYKNLLSFDDVTDARNMFYGSTLTEIPAITFNGTSDSSAMGMFMQCYNLTTFPTLATKKSGKENLDCVNMFNSCKKLVELPNNTYFSSVFATGAFAGNNYSFSGMFQNCQALTKLSDLSIFDRKIRAKQYSTDTNQGNYLNLFNNCQSLQELSNFPLRNSGSTYDINMFTETFYKTYSLRKLTFSATGSFSWSNQVIDLSTAGYSNSVADSVYNHNSAVETLNSLPTVSGSSNYIKFKNGAGSATSGGSISDLTAEEIAVATAKGWTVSLVN